jgi:hypothetical protein
MKEVVPTFDESVEKSPLMGDEGQVEPHLKIFRQSVAQPQVEAVRFSVQEQGLAGCVFLDEVAGDVGRQPQIGAAR